MSSELTFTHFLGHRVVRGRADAVRRRWENGEEEPDSLALFQKHPELLTDTAFALDLIYEEFSLRVERGEKLDIESFCARFPFAPGELVQMLASCRFLDEKIDTILPKTAKAIHWPHPGDRIGDLELLRELGRGTFAQVFLARETSTGGRLVAVKFAEDCAHEALTIGPLNHKNIVKVLSAGSEAKTGLSVVRMPYHGPATLKNLMDRAGPQQRAASPQQARVILETAQSDEIVEEMEAPAPILQSGTYEDGVVWLIGKIAGALAFLHQRGISHRDLKPTNVLLSPSGQPLLLDFNLSAASTLASTRKGGTLPYLPPEQLRAVTDNSLPAGGPEADVFALGVIAHELLTGQHPFGPIPRSAVREELAELLLQRQGVGAEKGKAPPDSQAQLAKPTSWRQDTPFARLLVQCLEIDPGARPTAAQLQAAAQELLAPARPSRRWLSRSRAAVLAAAIVLLALTSSGIGWIREATHAAPAPVTRPSKQEEAASWFEKGRRHLDSNERVLAYDCFQKSNQQVSDGQTLACMAYLQSLKRSHQDAINLSEQAIGHGFKNAAIYNNRGYSTMLLWDRDARESKGRDVAIYESALADFNEAIARDPKSTVPYRNLTHLICRLGSQCRRTDPSWTPSDEVVKKVREGMRLETVGPRQAADAARVLIYASARSPEMKEEALAALTRAAEKGFDSPSLQKYESELFSPLKDDPRYQQLVNTPQRKVAVIREDGLLNPIPASAR